MSKLHTDAPRALEAAILENSRASSAALWRDARGERVYRSDVLISLIAVAALAAAFVGPSHSILMAATVPLALLAGYAARTTRQIAALGALLERAERQAASRAV